MGRIFTVTGLVGLFTLVGTLLSILPGYIAPSSHWGLEVKRFEPLFASRKLRSPDDVYLAGAGKADITGPVVELNLMGYAMLQQIGTGLRQRLHARAFIYGDPDEEANRLCYIVLDNCMGDTAIRDGILKGLAASGGDYAKYTSHNVAVTGTHSHSGPGGWLNYLLPQVTNLGFDHQSYNAIVDGAVLAIKRAHDSLAPSHLSVGTTSITDGNTNRSPYAYQGNPEDERKQYEYDTDKTMTLLRATRVSDNKTTSVLTWFPVHGTSLYNNNTLVAADNKGVAAWLFERSIANDTRFDANFVSGFSQANVGDTSPNVLGAWCEDGSNQKCSFVDSTCNGRNEDCHGRGPYFREKDNGAQSCFEMGRRQYAAASKICDTLEQGGTQVTGKTIASFHTYQNFTNWSFTSPLSGKQVKTCSPAMGYAFAGGTTDGPGAFDFTQNVSSPANDNPLWHIARNVLHAPSKEQVECQGKKSVLMDIGSMNTPYAWGAHIVDMQVMRVGQLFIIVSSGEASTMAGRRWKKAIAEEAKSKLQVKEPIVVLGGPANSYVHYITTPEEYDRQRYEGGSTIHGPHSLDGHIRATVDRLPSLVDMSKAAAIPVGPNPPINTNNSLDFITKVVFDTPPLGKQFGDVASGPDDKVYKPGDTVTTTFIGANPRNNLRLEGSFGSLKYRNDSGDWETMRSDKDWTFTYKWKRTNSVLGTSEATLEWYVDDDYYQVGNPNALKSGTYRMHYYGDAKHPITRKINGFEGVGPTFTVEA